MAGETSRENGKKGGRPKGFAALEAEATRNFIAEQVKNNNASIVSKAIVQAMEGNHDAREWLYDRAFGKPQKFIDHTTDGEKLPTPLLNEIPSDDSTQENPGA